MKYPISIQNSVFYIILYLVSILYELLKLDIIIFNISNILERLNVFEKSLNINLIRAF